MNENKFLLLLKGEDKTRDVKHFANNYSHYEITFDTGKKYTYSKTDFMLLDKPKLLNSEKYSGREFIDKILQFDTYYKVFFRDGSTSLKRSSSFSGNRGKAVYNYLLKLSNYHDIRFDDIPIIRNRIVKAYFRKGNQLLHNYLKGSLSKNKRVNNHQMIFPFGLNKSQREAVHKALNHKVSVIEGPPGTGKTQTILNIIANLLVQGNKVGVVSNNNSATENIYEKLEKNELSYFAAKLGSSENISKFVGNQSQKGNKPYKRLVFTNEGLEIKRKQTAVLGNQIESDLKKATRVAYIANMLKHFQQEKEYFDQHFIDKYSFEEYCFGLKSLKIKKLKKFLEDLEKLEAKLAIKDLNKRIDDYEEIKIPFLDRVVIYSKYSLRLISLLKKDIQEVIFVAQNEFYIRKIETLSNELKELKKVKSTKSIDDKMKEYTEKSMEYFKNFMDSRTIVEGEEFTKGQIRNVSKSFLKRYPLILSSAFSISTTLGDNFTFDYIIVDEASQLSLDTAFLTLSCAKNIVVVGDSMQLSNVVTSELKKKSESLSEEFDVHDFYQVHKNSFLDSIKKVFPNAPNTLLKEHYRSHPMIINFSNAMFYRNQLIPMTIDNGEKDVIKVFNGRKGNFKVFGTNSNIREIAIIREEVLEELNSKTNDVAVIAPYRDQVKAIKKEFPKINCNTIHSFQGRENDAIIFSTVDTKNEFVNNDNLVNVALTRAKKYLRVITTGCDNDDNSLISNFVRYARYNDFETIDSKVISVFDLLNNELSENREEILRKYKKVSDFPSENLINGIIEEVFEKNDIYQLDVSLYVSLRSIVKDDSSFSEREKSFYKHPCSHIDFLIYRKSDKSPFLAIEVDGKTYHNCEVQKERDSVKDSILKKIEIPILRLNTGNSINEYETILEEIQTIFSKWNS